MKTARGNQTNLTSAVSVTNNAGGVAVGAVVHDHLDVTLAADGDLARVVAKIETDN
jgi:hypothetical protein